MVLILLLVFIAAVVLAILTTREEDAAPPVSSNLDTFINLYEAIESQYTLGIISKWERAELMETLDREALKSAEEHLERLEYDAIK